MSDNLPPLRPSPSQRLGSCDPRQPQTEPMSLIIESGSSSSTQDSVPMANSVKFRKSTYERSPSIPELCLRDILDLWKKVYKIEAYLRRNTPEQEATDQLIQSMGEEIETLRMDLQELRQQSRPQASRSADITLPPSPRTPSPIGWTTVNSYKLDVETCLCQKEN